MVIQEEIKDFLEGNDPEEHIVAIKYDYLLYNGISPNYKMKYSHTLSHHKRNKNVVKKIKEIIYFK